MSGSITLHSKLGVNPRMTVCPQCGGDGDELMLLGNQNKKYTCPSCDMLHYGLPERTGGVRRCQRKGCGQKYGKDWKKEELTEWEKLPAPGPCKKCRDSVDKCREEVKKGGIFWICADCKRTGAIKADNELAKAVRKQHNIQAPKPVGVEFTKNDCPACGPNAVLTPDSK